MVRRIRIRGKGEFRKESPDEWCPRQGYVPDSCTSDVSLVRGSFCTNLPRPPTPEIGTGGGQEYPECGGLLPVASPVSGMSVLLSEAFTVPRCRLTHFTRDI